MKQKSLIALFAFILFAFIGCAGLPEADVRRLTTEYRDQWIQREKPESQERLQIGIIESIEPIKGGWHVIFVTETGHEYPTGMHDYYVHVFMDKKGRLDKVVRGPDRLS